MKDWQVIMSVDGQDDEPMSVTTGLPQGWRISPAPFAIYIAEMRDAVGGRVGCSRGVSFVDDVTWLVEGTDLSDVVSKLERCAAARLQWVDSNAVRFEASKTEAILFFRKRMLHK